MRKVWLLALGLLATLSSFAQLRPVVANSNYSITNAMWLNPSSMVDSKPWLDINLVGMSAFAHNNFVHLPESNYWTLLRDSSQVPMPIYDSTRSFRRTGFATASVQAPAFTLNIGKHAIGMHITGRSYTSVNRIPYKLAQLAYEGLDYDPLQNESVTFKNAHINHMSWAELGLSYGKIIHQRAKDIVTAGITIKRLYGIASGGMRVNHLNYIVDDTGRMSLFNFDGDLYYAEPAWKSGKGWGADLGFTYKRMLEPIDSYIPHSKFSGCRNIGYLYKIGVSFLDVGRIRYNQNAEHHNYTNGEGVLADDIEASYEGIEAAVTNSVTENVQQTTTNEYTQHLPTAISVHADGNLGYGFYANATWVQRIKIGRKPGVTRPNMLTLSARFEHKRLEVGIPVTLYEYRHLALGLSVRLSHLIIGTDHLVPFLFKHKLSRGDIYFNLKIPFNKSPKCRPDRSPVVQGGRKANRKYRQEGVQFCPTFEKG